MAELHPFAPVYDGNSRVLILGSFPSVKSRGEGFYYGHPRNRFWAVLSALFGGDEPHTIADKKAFLLANHLALWDVCASCDVTGSSDASIRHAVPNEMGAIFTSAPIRLIVTNGTTADRLYRKLIFPKTGINAVSLPSTSPANAAFNLADLIEQWKIILS